MKCKDYLDPICNRRDKSPGACNGCEKSSKCYFDKYIYNAVEADANYHDTLVESREGVNLTEEELELFGSILAPLLKNGQSIYQICSSHPEITVSSRSLYNYIEKGVFKKFGIDNFSLKEQVNRKKRASSKLKKRKEPACYTGHEYKDFLVFCKQHPDIPIVEMDTLYNNKSGPYLQTFIFQHTGLMIGFLHKEKTVQNMVSAVDLIQERIGPLMFSKIFSLVLTDRGSEFIGINDFEIGKDSSSRLNLFFCDPQCSSQKPHVENNHNYVRDIIPNEYPMENLTQDDIDLMFSHINSVPRLSWHGKTPYEMFSFIYDEATLQKLNIRQIDRDDVILKLKLIYAKNR